jgi:hypothetical protein
MLNVDLESILVQLAAADDVGGEVRDVIDIDEGSVLPVLAREENGASSLDPHDGAVAEPYRADDAEIELHEDPLDTGHMVGGPYVEDPPLGVSLSRISQHRIHLLLHQLDALLGHRQGDD